jgi:exodeoxyribonuclease VII large subunit
VIKYKFERLEVTLPEIKKSLEQNIHFIIQQNEQHLEYVNKKIEMNDPKLQCKKGWGQVAIDGKTITLSEVEINQKFIIQDAETQIEALCLNKV